MAYLLYPAAHYYPQGAVEKGINQGIDNTATAAVTGIENAAGSLIRALPWWVWLGAGLFALHYVGTIKKDWLG